MLSIFLAVAASPVVIGDDSCVQCFAMPYAREPAPLEAALEFYHMISMNKLCVCVCVCVISGGSLGQIAGTLANPLVWSELAVVRGATVDPTLGAVCVTTKPIARLSTQCPGLALIIAEVLC